MLWKRSEPRYLHIKFLILTLKSRNFKIFIKYKNYNKKYSFIDLKSYQF